MQQPRNKKKMQLHAIVSLWNVLLPSICSVSCSPFEKAIGVFFLNQNQQSCHQLYENRYGMILPSNHEF